MNSKRYFHISSAVTTLALGFFHFNPAHADFLLKPNDRVVFFGDSITEVGNYTRPFQDFVYARYPQSHIRFFNAGWSGDKLPGGLNRLERDVLSRQPNVVTICFGMNDGNYTRLSDDLANTYRNNLDAIVKILTDKKIRVVIFSPPPVDYDKQPSYVKVPLGQSDYNATLSAFGTIASEIAKKYRVPYIDIIHPIMATQAAMKAKDPAYVQLTDGVHPDPKGGVVMAGAMLLGMGAEPMPSLAEVSAAGLSGPDKTQIQLAGPLPIPVWLPDDSVAPAMVSGFLNVAAPRLLVHGLAPGRYEVSIGDGSIGQWSASELDKGVLMPGVFSTRSQRIAEVTRWKESNYFNAWRVVNLHPEKGPATDGAVAGLLQADEGFQSAIDSLNRPMEGVTITVKPTGLAAGLGPNLALKKSYVVSDPNVDGFGYGGLTDGSWVSRGTTHVFATGHNDTFPKTATIDLGQISPISYVLLGVPPYGSTRTVAVAISSDGQNFSDVGAYVFSTRKEERHTYAFAVTPARYVRVTYPDHYPQEFDYYATFGFTSEVEVYGPTQ